MRSTAIAYAEKRGVPHELAEDFAHDWIVKIQCSGKKQRLAQAFVDFVRETFGRKGQKNYFPIKEDSLGTYTVDECGINLDRLKDIDENLFVLMLEGRSYDEKCSMLGVSVVTVFKRQIAIRKAINKVFGIKLSCYRSST